MIQNEIVIARGFDLFFHGATESMLQCIADGINDCCTYDLDGQRATLMFEKHARIPFGELESIHEVLNQQGRTLAAKYECIYEASEIYVTVSASVAEWMVDNGH